VTDTPRTDALLILIVDDIEDARYLYSLYLTTHGLAAFGKTRLVFRKGSHVNERGEAPSG